MIKTNAERIFYMNRNELIQLAEKNGITKKKADESLDIVIDLLKDAFSTGNDVTLRGFGTFKVRSYKPHTGRNPRTGEEMITSERKRITFKTGKTLLDLVN